MGTSTKKGKVIHCLGIFAVMLCAGPVRSDELGTRAILILHVNAYSPPASIVHLPSPPVPVTLPPSPARMQAMAPIYLHPPVYQPVVHRPILHFCKT